MKISTQRMICTPIVSALLLIMSAFAVVAEAKGPPSQADFVIATEHGYEWFDTFVATGMISDSGYFTVEATYVRNGETWARYRFWHFWNDLVNDPNSNYFEVDLPVWPDPRIDYDFVLTAGPDGYLNGDLLYEGDWAIGTATARIRKITTYPSEGYYKHKVQYDAVEWTFSGFLVQ